MTATKPVVVITGCSSGIGAALAKSFPVEKYEVFATARNIEKLKTVGLPAGITFVQLNVTKKESVKQAIEEIVIKTGGRIDILINNAGTNTAVGPSIEVDLDRFRETYEANYFGLLAVTQAVAPHMIARKTGTIVNIGSTVGLCALPYSGAYSSSKAAVHSLSDVLRVELAPFGVKVVVVAPGAIKSSIGEVGTSNIYVPPSSSPYASAAEQIRRRAEISQAGNPTPTLVFASKVYREVTRKHPRAYLIAGASSTSAFFAYYFPTWFKDWLVSSMFKLSSLSRS